MWTLAPGDHVTLSQLLLFPKKNNTCLVEWSEVKWNESHSVVSDSLQPHGLYSPWNSPGQNTGVGSLSLLQGIFPTQRSNPGLPHCRWILYQLSHKGSPRIPEWVAYPFSWSSWPRNWTGVSCIAGGFFTNSAIREALYFIAGSNLLLTDFSFCRSVKSEMILYCDVILNFLNY